MNEPPRIPPPIPRVVSDPNPEVLPPVHSSQPPLVGATPSPHQAHGNTASGWRLPAWLKLHALSGALIIFFDNVFFGGEIITLELAWPVLSFLAFTLTFTSVFFVQKFRSRDSFLASFGKALFSGVLAGFPTSIGGTVFGSLVLFLSGMSVLNRK